MVAAARHRLLMLDYDGTLAPFHEVRGEALPLPRSLEFLREIVDSAHTDVAVVSGRPVRELERLLGPLAVTMVGEHGWEERLPDGALVRHPVPGEQLERLDEGERLVREHGLGSRLERKRTGLVLHTRALPAARAREVEDAVWVLWEPLAAGGAPGLERIDGGVELRARGRDKGSVVLGLVRDAPAATLAVFVGDDVTDEDAFEVVRDRGFGVRVGAAERPTLAAAGLPAPSAVAEFLEEWLRVVGASGRRAGKRAPGRRKE
jgi:trehalose-phosphatase